MPTAASVAPKPAAPKSRTGPVNRAPEKAAPQPTLVKENSKTAAPALPAFARSALAPNAGTPSPASLAPATQPRALKPSAPKLLTAKPRPKVIAIPLKGEGHSPGKPLPPHIQASLEDSFSIDLGAVRIHTDEAAQDTTGSLSARAFTYGTHIFLGKGESPGDMGLMAHEAAHIVQQQGISTVQMWSPSRSDPYEREADHASAAVQRGDTFNVRERVPAPRVQRFPGLGKILDYLAEKAYNIPGYRMFTVIIGKNPINNEDVDRSAANVLRGAVEFIPGGHQITQVLDQYNAFEKVGSWVNDQIATVKGIAHSIVNAFWEFVHSLGISDVPHPIRTWERAEAIFSGPIHQIINFIKGLAEGIWHFIRDAILKPIARLAEGAPGWDLLLAVLGKNPITGEKVASDADAVVGGFMKLIHQDELWANIKKANALSRIWAWFQTNIKQLVSFVSEIPSLFIDALKSLELTDIINLPRGFMKIVHVFGNFVGRFASWALDATWSLLQIIFEVVAPGAMPYLKKLGASFRTVLKNPIGFVGNLVRAAKLGFQQFANHIGAHLKNAFINWLTGSMPGVYIPASLDFGEIIKFVLSVLGLTWQNIRQKLVKVMGEPAVKAMETGFDIVVTLVREGPAAAWDKIKEYAGNLKDMAMNAIMDYIVVEVVKKAIAKVVSMFIPGGAFISAIISIYDTIVVFISKLSKMIQIATAFLDSMMEIASGAIGAAANKVEGTLEGLLSLAISFLAGFLGLGKIADKVMNIINTKIRAPIDSALDKVVDWIATGAKKLFGAAKAGVASIVTWWKSRLSFSDTSGESHSLFFQGEAASAVLTVASTPAPVNAFLSRIGASAQASGDAKVIAAYNRAVGLASAIDLLRAKVESGPTPRQPADIDALNKNMEKLAAELPVLVPLGFPPLPPGSLVVGNLIKLKAGGSIAKITSIDTGPPGMVHFAIIRPGTRLATTTGLSIAAYGKAFADYEEDPRQLYLGSTPDRTSAVGAAVKTRMKAEGKWDLPGHRNEAYSSRTGKWYPESDCDMGHIIDAVTWWNSNGRLTGAQSGAVIKFMNDPINYELEPSSVNRSRGAALGAKYLPPAV